MACSVEVLKTCGIAILSLNRPHKLNAITLDMIVALEAALTALEHDDAVGAIVLRGNGRAFCAGDDLDEQIEIAKSGPDAVAEQLRMLQSISMRIVLSDKPVVALVHGWAVGAGFSWVVNCDFSIWAEGAKAFLPEVAAGTFVTGGVSYLLPLRAGAGFARELLLTGRAADCEALRLAGLANRVLPAAGLEQDGLEFARQLAQVPRSSFALMKQAIVAVQRDAFLEALRREAEACLATSRDTAAFERLRSVQRSGAAA